MITSREVWLRVYAAVIRFNGNGGDAGELADQAVVKFESRFPQAKKDDGEFKT